MLSSLALLARDLGVLSWDLSLFTTAEFGFFKLSDSFTTGSSIMPQKKNPDVVELTRARAALFPGWLAQVLAVGALPSGYHRDYQLTKGPLFAALDAMALMLDVAARLPSALSVNAARCAAAVTEDLLATHEAIALVRAGTPFRAAYRATAERARSRVGEPRPVVGAALPGYSGAPGRPDWKAVEADAGREHAVAGRAPPRPRRGLGRPPSALKPEGPENKLGQKTYLFLLFPYAARTASLPATGM